MIAAVLMLAQVVQPQPFDAAAMQTQIAAAKAAADAAQATADAAAAKVAAQWVAQQVVTLDATGNATWTFDPTNRPPVIPAVVHMPKLMDMQNPVSCNFVTITVASVTVHCWRSNVLGLLPGLYSGSVTGAQVNLVARAIP